MPIHLEAPRLIEIIGITEDGFVAKVDMRQTGDQFVMLVVITSFDKRLRIDV